MHPQPYGSDTRKELALPSKREQDATYYPQNIPIPHFFYPQQTLTFQRMDHLLSTQRMDYIRHTQRKILGEWVAVISKVYSGQDFDPKKCFTPAIASIIEAFQASTATCTYALAVFRRLWRTGHELHKELVEAILERKVLPRAVKKHPTEVLILGTFYWALWVASATLNDQADCFPWYNWLGVEKSQLVRFQIAALRDLRYDTLLPSDDWKRHLNSLLRASQPLGFNPKFHFILMELETEIKTASSQNCSL